MFTRAFWAPALLVCLTVVAPVAVQAQGDYLDVYVTHVKPEKVSEFEALAKKVVDANRRNNGDTWLAMQTVYGEGDTYVFVSGRQDYASVDKGGDAFFAALTKTYGKDAASKMMHDWEGCLSDSRTELRKRRPDLSRKMPEGADYAKLIGESRVLRTTVVHVRPGHVTEFEDFMKEYKTSGEQSANAQPLLVSQAIEGGHGTTFYVTSLRPSLGGFDNNPTMKEILGDDGYKKFLQVSSDAIEGSQSAILRFSAELSNPPQSVMAAAPDFWNPKPMVAAHKAKAKEGEMKPAADKAKDQK